MKNIFIIFILLTYSSLSQASNIPKIYKNFGDELDATLVIVPYGEKNHYLIRFHGFEHDNDGKTLLYKKQPIQGSYPERGYVLKLIGTNIINFRNEKNKQTLIYGTLVHYTEVYLSGDKKIKMIYSDKGGRRLYEKLVSQYRETQGILESKVKVKRTIKDAKDNFTKLCKQALTINVDWAAFTAKNQKTTPGMVKAYVFAMTKICTKDDDYRSAIKKITTLKVIPSNTKGKDNISIQGSTLSIAIDQDAPNVSETSYRKLLNIL